MRARDLLSRNSTALLVQSIHRRAAGPELASLPVGRAFEQE